MENAVKNLLDFATPEEARNILWEWFRCTVVGNYSSLDKKSKDGIACLYEQLDQVISEMKPPAAT
jgi:hypothetical protein